MFKCQVDRDPTSHPKSQKRDVGPQTPTPAALEDKADALPVDLIGGEGLEDFGEGELDRGAVFNRRRVNGGF